MIRWPGKVPAGKVENGIISGLDWFPTFLAAAGNPNIADELLKGKQIGDRTYKDHLDGYNQMDMITGKGPSNRHEIFYFGESTLGAVRIDDYKYRFIDQPGGWLGDKTQVDVPYLTNLRLDPFERTGWPDNGTQGRRAAVLRLVQVRILALRVRPAGGGEARDDGHRVPADAEGRELQPRCREGEDRGGPRRQWPSKLAHRRPVGSHGRARRILRGKPHSCNPEASVTMRTDHAIFHASNRTRPCSRRWRCFHCSLPRCRSTSAVLRRRRPIRCRPGTTARPKRRSSTSSHASRRKAGPTSCRPTSASRPSTTTARCGSSSRCTSSSPSPSTASRRWRRSTRNGRPSSRSRRCWTAT